MGFLISILLIFLFAGIFIFLLIVGFFRSLFGFGRRNTPKDQTQNETYNSKSAKHKKVFDKNEGEYVDFEEVRD